MLLFIEGPDKAGKTTLMENLKRFGGFETFTLPYPATLFDEADVNPTDYFLGANTFLLEAYKNLVRRTEAFEVRIPSNRDLAVHRGFISEFVYGPLFGRAPDEWLTRWWVEQWPADTSLVFLNISHQTYNDRATAKYASQDTIPLMAPARWQAIQNRYRLAMDILVSMGKYPTFISGEDPFDMQWEGIRMDLRQTLGHHA